MEASRTSDNSIQLVLLAKKRSFDCWLFISLVKHSKSTSNIRFFRSSFLLLGSWSSSGSFSTSCSSSSWSSGSSSTWIC